MPTSPDKFENPYEDGSVEASKISRILERLKAGHSSLDLRRLEEPEFEYLVDVAVDLLNSRNRSLQGEQQMDLLQIEETTL